MRRPGEAPPRAGSLAGANGAAGPSGEVVVTDLRRGGWSWGWDTLAREFAGLIGLSGVGLYFAYATYTDNRKESPFRGSSYTGVDALETFTGESADEIRAVNKLLAALGLARFETYTVPTVGRDGRRGTRNRLHCYLLDRDPHLTADDLAAALRAALEDERVYRRIRHVFRDEFRPIDRAEDAAGAPRERPNPWYAILATARETPPWRGLAARAAGDQGALRRRNARGVEAAAARRRRARGDEPSDGVLPATEDAASTALRDAEDGGVLPGTESGPPAWVRQSEVAPAGPIRGRDGKHDQATIKQTESDRIRPEETTTRASPNAGLAPATRGVESRGGDGADEGIRAAVAVYERANGRAATPMERDLLDEMARGLDAAARAASPPAGGAAWVAAAVREAVDAGSRYVSPRRLRAICERWADEGFRSERPAAAPAPRPRRSEAVARWRAWRREGEPDGGDGTDEDEASAADPDELVAEAVVSESPRLTNRELWELILAECRGQLSPPRLGVLEAHAAVAAVESDALVVVARNRLAAEQVRAAAAALAAAAGGALRRRYVTVRCVTLEECSSG